MTKFLVTVERMSDCRRFTRTFEATSEKDAMRQAYRLLNVETGADYYVVSCVAV